MKKATINDCTILVFPKKAPAKEVIDGINETFADGRVPSMFYVDFSDDDIIGAYQSGDAKKYEKAVNNAFVTEVLTMGMLYCSRNERREKCRFDLFPSRPGKMNEACIEGVTFDQMVAILAAVR